MSEKQPVEVDIRLWSADDLPLLERLLGDPAMTGHIGGPETKEKIRKRHESYCDHGHLESDCQFAIVAGPGRTAAGWVGYWEREWQGQTVLEAGWLVLPEFQGRGIASKAVVILVEQARANTNIRFMHAYPSVDNGPSNKICKKAGFTLQGEVDFEYPPGHFMRCNDWCLGLSPLK